MHDGIVCVGVCYVHYAYMCTSVHVRREMCFAHFILLKHMNTVQTQAFSEFLVGQLNY